MPKLLALVSHLWTRLAGPRTVAEIRASVRQLSDELSEASRLHTESSVYFASLASAHSSEASAAELLRASLPKL